MSGRSNLPRWRREHFEDVRRARAAAAADPSLLDRYGELYVYSKLLRRGSFAVFTGRRIFAAINADLTADDLVFPRPLLALQMPRLTTLAVPDGVSWSVPVRSLGGAP